MNNNDSYLVLTEAESVCASWHKDIMAKWYSLQGPSEPVLLASRVKSSKENMFQKMNKFDGSN